MNMSEPVHNAQRLKELQALPLDRKIHISQARIIEWYVRNKGNVVISFSGGKDSTVLLHLVRSLFPDVPAVFANTGLEYPEIQRFVRSVPNCTIVTPTMRFDQVISTYGYPLIGKEVAEAIYYARRIRSQSIKVERENETQPCCVSAENSSVIGGGNLIQTGSSANRRTILQGKWGRGGDSPPAQSTTWVTEQRPTDAATTSTGSGKQRDFKRIELGAEQEPVDGSLSEGRVQEMGYSRTETANRGKWSDYHRRSLNNDPNDPRDRECFYDRDPSKTDWHDWRRGCL